MIAGTVPPHMLRLILAAALEAGVKDSDLVRVRGMAAIHEDGVRLSSAMALDIWQIAGDEMEAWGGGARIATLWQPGLLSSWDYLFRTAPTLTGGLTAGANLLAAVRDPLESAEVTMDAAGAATVVYRTPYADLSCGSMINELAMGLILREARAAVGRHLRPQRVTFTTAPPPHHRHLVELFGTDDMHFGAEHTTITFTEADAAQPLPEADPVLAAIMRSYTETTITSARPMLGWLDQLHTAIREALQQGSAPTLRAVAHRMATSPRTLQRRLREEDTTWRTELERVRHTESARLLRESSLGVESIATRVGYADVRALRRAFHRLHGVAPSEYRRRTAR
ncbi:AraC family transcriptional regulator [Nocardia otitidiscaviarum]|uniref:AraC family transcriptional regulator n=1 Tax=Nocardia otitidiscaviarum TaxID=1823 RepID=UPI00163DA858|nr:AraC family transcriptional regulator [Nocardia otitidiscaviarum]MCP9623549.1 AraC family transcriptional regulator [Nocardia otitidiscaviarum]